MKKILAAVLLLVVVALGAFFLHAPPSAIVAIKNPADEAAKAGIAPDATGTISETVTAACAGRHDADLSSLSEVLLRRMGRPEAENTWRVATVAENGREYRLRIAAEGNESKAPVLKIFSVDREGLPDLLSEEKRDAEAVFASFVRGKTILSRLASREFSAADGSRLRVEKENDVVVELEYTHASSRRHLACSGKNGCRCL